MKFWILLKYYKKDAVSFSLSELDKMRGNDIAVKQM